MRSFPISCFHFVFICGPFVRSFCSIFFLFLSFFLSFICSIVFFGPLAYGLRNWPGGEWAGWCGVVMWDPKGSRVRLSSGKERSSESGVRVRGGSSFLLSFFLLSSIIWSLLLCGVRDRPSATFLFGMSVQLRFLSPPLSSPILSFPSLFPSVFVIPSFHQYATLTIPYAEPSPFFFRSTNTYGHTSVWCKNQVIL